MTVPAGRPRAAALLLALTLLVVAGAAAVWWQARPEPADRMAPVPAGVSTAPTTAMPTPPPIVSRSEVEHLKSAVVSANRDHVAAIFAHSGDEALHRIRTNEAIVALGRALYRHHVLAGAGDLASARAEMRSFLSGLEQDGLGLSEPVIDEGVASVAP